MAEEKNAEAEGLKAEGNKLLGEGNLEGAVEAYSKAIAISENQVYYSNRSNAYSQLKKYDLALQDAEKCIELKPDWVRGYSRKGLALFFLGRYEQAAENYLAGLKIDPSNVSFAEEFRRCSSMAQAAPFLVDDWQGKLVASQLTNQLMQDPAYIEKIEKVRANPASLPALLNVDEDITRAYIVLAGKEEEVRAQQAEQAKRQADLDRKKREDVKAHKEKMAKKAEEDAFNALSDEEKAALAEKNLGNEAYKAKKFEEAIKHYEAALALTPNNILLLTNQASVLMAQKKFEEAIACCDRAIEKGKEIFADYTAMAKAYERKGRCLQKLARYAESVEALEEAILNNRTTNLVKFRNQVLELKKKKDEEDYLNPELAAEAKAEGNEFFKKMEWGKAIQCYREAIKRDPTNHIYYSNLAQTYFKVREFQLALDAASKCVEIDPKFLKGIARKAQAQYLLKEYYKALATYEEGLKIDPTYQDFQEGIQKVTYAINTQRGQEGNEEARQKAMADPEIQRALRDPEVQNFIKALQEGDQQRAQRMLGASEELSKKYKLLNAAGLM